MKNTAFVALYYFRCVFGVGAAIMLALVGARVAAAQSNALAPGTVHLTPASVTLADGREVAYEEGLLFVPENRRAEDSRVVAVRFRRFPAQKGADGPPVFYLPGGPGSTLDQEELASEKGREIVDFFTKVGDLVVVDQRGNPNVAAPFIPKMEMHVSGVPLDQPGDPAAMKKANRDAFTAALERWRARGVDLAGYDIFNTVDDVDDLRAALGYDRLILRGNSFGSQWSFAYMKRHPERVARAMLGGVEPLNRAYDRPADVWAAHRRIARLAENDPDLRGALPEEGLIPAIRGLLDRLEEDPVRVTIPRPEPAPPGMSDSVTVVLGRYDLQQALKKFAPDYYTREGLQTWPRFILEMLGGDFRYLAALTVGRRQADRTPLIFPLIDNSLGITAARDRRLRRDSAKAMVGPINSFYYATRDLSPTPGVGDAFRTGLAEVQVPVLMIQGDLDRSTPVENALHIDEVLPNSHLLYVENGTHMAIRELRQFCPEVTAEVLEFLKTGSFEGLPVRVALPPPDFERPGAGRLYEQFAGDARIPE